MSDEIAVCRLLRTKQTNGVVIGGMVVPWESGESTTASYWCLGTMETCGPDDLLAHPHHCRAARACYRARD
jgi:hypothetical protein